MIFDLPAVMVILLLWSGDELTWQYRGRSCLEPESRTGRKVDSVETQSLREPSGRPETNVKSSQD